MLWAQALVLASSESLFCFGFSWTPGHAVSGEAVSLASILFVIIYGMWDVLGKDRGLLPNLVGICWLKPGAQLTHATQLFLINNTTVPGKKAERGAAALWAYFALYSWESLTVNLSGDSDPADNRVVEGVKPMDSAIIISFWKFIYIHGADFKTTDNRL